MASSFPWIRKWNTENLRWICWQSLVCNGFCWHHCYMYVSVTAQWQWQWKLQVMDLLTKAETPILWPPHAKSWLIGKDPDVGKDWGQEEKGTAEDEMVGWHHRLDGHGFGWTLGVGDGHGVLACSGSWHCKESDTTERLKGTEGN